MKQVTAAVLVKDGKILIAQRKLGDFLAGKWEFPGGKMEPGETPEAAAIREVSEETGWDCEITSPLYKAEYSFLRGEMMVDKEVHWFLVKRVGGDGLPRTPDEVLDMKWLPLAEAENELIYKSDLEIIDLLKKF